jgi:uncharacterized protein YdaU (DUF1376 family)
MNFYPHHIGDYMTATAHLSWLEDAAYRRLMDLYYVREKYLPADRAQVARLVRATSKDERKAVDVVLDEFFILVGAGWSHKRCDLEIIKAAEAAERARVNGKKGGRPAKFKPKANPEITQPVILANPEITKSQAPITNTNTNTIIQTPIPPEGAKPDRKKSAVALKTFLDECKTKGEMPIPDDCAAITYANSVGIPPDFLWLQWREFLDRYKLPDAKRYKDWRIVFLKSVRGNWFKLWYVKDDYYVLATAGLQAKKLHGDKAA